MLPSGGSLRISVGFSAYSPPYFLSCGPPTKQHGKILFQGHRKEAVLAPYSKDGERFPATEEGHRQWEVKDVCFCIPLRPVLGTNHLNKESIENTMGHG